MAEIIVGWIVFSALVGALWSYKKKGFFTGFIVSLILSPLIGFIIALVIKPNVKEVEAEEIKSGFMKKCPYCAELIKVEAIVCRYCGKELPKAAINSHNNIYSPASEVPKITQDELNELRKKAGKNAINYAYVIGSEWCCVCGVKNFIGNQERIILCKKCGRNRDVVLQKYRKPILSLS